MESQSTIQLRRIAIDMPWDASAHMGTGAYCETMVRALSTAAPQVQLSLLVPRGIPRAINAPNVRYIEVSAPAVRREGMRHLGIPNMLLNLQPDCLFAPATLLPSLRVCPMVATVHDLTFKTHPGLYDSALESHLNYWVPSSCRCADHLVAISKECRDSVIRELQLPQTKITVVEQPVRTGFERSLNSDDVTECLRRLKVYRPYFFHVSNLATHKNVIFAIEAFAKWRAAHLSSDATFIVAGGSYSPSRPPDLSAAARSVGIENAVRYIGRIGDDDLKGMYQGCEALLFPSLCEGWGLPVAEASALGCRVIASPYVPAASEFQRVPLEVNRWVEAMAAPDFGRVGIEPTGFRGAGESLLKVLEQVVAGTRPRELQIVGSRETETTDVNKGTGPHTGRTLSRPPMNIVVTVDDVRPEAGLGLELDKGYMRELIALHNDCGCRFTLFIPTNYHSRCDLRDHSAWFKELLAIGCFEVAVHGHHHWNLSAQKHETEYMVRDLQEASECLQRSLNVFADLGYEPVGVKPPGWNYSAPMLEAISTRFRYMADHIVDTRWNRDLGIARLPYTKCIHEKLDLGATAPLMVLHSHLSSEGGMHDNGWTPSNVQNVRNFLTQCHATYGAQLAYATASEAYGLYCTPEVADMTATEPIS